jgi:hypothetical protein
MCPEMNICVTIAHFFPRVAKEDFKMMARALPMHMLIEHNVGTLSIQPCPIEDALVGFNSPLEHHRFLDGHALSFHGYLVTFCEA